MRKRSTVALSVLFLSTWCIAGAAGGQTAGSGRARVDVSRLGSQVGQRVPDFSLPDHTGRVRTLESTMGPRGAMLVFLRSADW